MLLRKGEEALAHLKELHEANGSEFPAWVEEHVVWAFWGGDGQSLMEEINRRRLARLEENEGEEK